MATKDIFINASDARQNPLREHVIHEEGRLIERAILDAINVGYYSVTISNGTPMTNSTPEVGVVQSIDPKYGIFNIPNHPWKDGDIVKAISTGKLPEPLDASTFYYVIYIDKNNIKLASSFNESLSRRPQSVVVGQSVSTISISEPGDGYLYPPAVTFTGGNANIIATATSVLADWGSLYKIGVPYPGDGFTDQPTVHIIASGSGAMAGTVILGAVGLTISTAGAGYVINDILTVIGGIGAPTVALITEVDSIGAVQSVVLNNTGLYTTLPQLVGVTVSSTTGQGSGCTLNLTIGIMTVELVNSGSNYLAPPKVTITGTGSGAEVVATLIAGAVSGLLVTSSGSGYTDIPIVTITSGNDAEAYAVLQPTGIDGVVINSNIKYSINPTVTFEPVGLDAQPGKVWMTITHIRPLWPGLGYAEGDIVTFAGGLGTAVAQALITEVGQQGQVVCAILVNSGLYYALPVMDQNIVLGGSGSGAIFEIRASVADIELMRAGSGYVVPPTVVIAAPECGEQAVAIANISNSSVTSFSVVSIGLGYTTVPTVAVTNGYGASATAYLDPTGLADINLDNPGEGYTYANVIVAGGGGNANASAIISNGFVSGVLLTNSDSNFTMVPNVSIIGDGNGAVASATLIPSPIGTIVMTSNGADYNYPPTVFLNGVATGNAYLQETGVSRIIISNRGGEYTNAPMVVVTPNVSNQTSTIMSPSITPILGYAVDSITINDGGSGYQIAPTVSMNIPQDPNGTQATAVATIGMGTNTLIIQSYTPSRDYFAAWKGMSVSNTNVIRPYNDRMDSIINYFTNWGYKIIRQTNPVTGNTLQWVINW